MRVSLTIAKLDLHNDIFCKTNYCEQVFKVKTFLQCRRLLFSTLGRMYRDILCVRLERVYCASFCP